MLVVVLFSTTVLPMPAPLNTNLLVADIPLIFDIVTCSVYVPPLMLIVVFADIPCVCRSATASLMVL